MKKDGPVVGATWQGEYLLQATLGDPTRGVYRAQRRRDSQAVVLRLWRSPTDALAREFIEHASAACSIRHPALAQLEACGREAHFCFLVSEYVVGQKLDTWADEVGIPPLGEVIDLMRRLSEGLALAARSGVHHTALHPRNVVMLQGEPATGRRAEPKLLDLGLPTLARSREPHALGAQFMAPEQLASVLEPSQPPLPPATAVMNVYSCGALLYYLCTGGPPHRHHELAALREAQLRGRLVLPSRINPQITASLNAVIVQALALDPKQRFASVAELAEALARVSLTPSVASARPVLSSLPPRGGSVPPRLAGAARASAVGLKRISSSPPLLSLPPGIARRPPPAATEFALELDTAKTGRIAPVTGRPPTTGYRGEQLEDDDVSEERESASSVPAGSFSSHPPPRPSPVAKEPPGVVATPLALFSGTPNLRPEPATQPARADPNQPQLITPQEAITARPPRSDDSRRSRLWLVALAGLVSAALFGVVRLLGDPVQSLTETSPMVTVDRPTLAPEPVAAVPSTPTPETPQPEPTEPTLAPSTLSDSDRESGSNVRGTRARNVRGSSTGAASQARESRASGAPQLATRDLPVEVDAAPARSAEVPAPSPGPAPSEAPPQLDESPPQVSKPARGAEPAAAAEVPRPLPTPSATPVTRSEDTAKQPLEARAAVREMTLRGALPTSWVRRAVERILPQFTACYAKAAQAAGQNQFGSLVVEVELDERGRARSPRARGAKLVGLNECVAEAASKVVSERTPDTGTVHASFKIIFTP